MTHYKDEYGNEDHCDSCHDDHDSGEFPMDECWDYSKARPDGTVPEEFRFCCCAQRRAYECTQIVGEVM